MNELKTKKIADRIARIAEMRLRIEKLQSGIEDYLESEPDHDYCDTCNKLYGGRRCWECFDESPDQCDAGFCDCDCNCN